MYACVYLLPWNSLLAQSNKAIFFWLKYYRISDHVNMVYTGPVMSEVINWLDGQNSLLSELNAPQGIAAAVPGEYVDTITSSVACNSVDQ